MKHVWLPAAIVLSLLAPAAAADDPFSEVSRDLVRREEVRAAVEEAFALHSRPARDIAERSHNGMLAVEALRKIGPEAVPYLANELEQERGDTYSFVVYALARIGTPEANRALRDAVRRAEVDRANNPDIRKALAVWGLGLQGDPEALELLFEGDLQPVSYAVHAQTSVVEAAGFLTAPESVPLLIERLAPPDPEESDGGGMRMRSGEVVRNDPRRYVLRALRRIGDERAVEAIVRMLREESHRAARAEAAYSLKTMLTPEAVSALVTALSDPEFSVRRAAALSLDEGLAAVPLATVLERLEAETDPPCRAALYRVAERAARSKEDLARLLAFDGGEASLDRRGLVLAVGHRDEPAVRELLERRMLDPDNGVAIAAAESLLESPDRDAREDVARAIPKLSWPVVSVVARRARLVGLDSFGDALAKRMLTAAGKLDPAESVSIRSTIPALGRALVAFDHVAALRKLERALPKIEDDRIAAEFRGTIEALRTIRKRIDSPDAWKKALAGDDPERRLMAIRRLVPRDDGLSTVLDAFPEMDAEDRTATLRALAGDGRAPVRALIERILSDETFDHPEHTDTRAWAAWAARRLGDDAMAKALGRSVERRSGRDAMVLAYAALLAGRDAGPALIRRYERERLLYPSGMRGSENLMLDRLATHLERGVPAREIDREPDRVALR